jgi:hypothetical protein
MAEHKTLTSQADSAVYVRLLEKGVTSATLIELVNQGKTAAEIEKMYEGDSK